jgi:HSP20 family protein
LWEKKMSVRDLIPWGRNSAAPATYRQPEQNPFLALHREMNRLFEDAFRDFGGALGPFGTAFSGAGWPSVEISETEKDVTVTAELPGLDEKDVEVLLEDDALVLRGEKRAETEDKDRAFNERFYGRFERVIPLGAEVDEGQISANFKNGVLTVKLPKTAKAQAKSRRIAINGGGQVH